MKKNKPGSAKIIKLAVIVLLTLGIAAAAIVISFRVRDRKYYEMIENSVAETVRDGCAYYGALDVREKYVYNEIASAAENISGTTGTMKFTIEKAQFEKIAEALRGDRPDLFYVDFDGLVLESGKKAEAIRIDMKYTADADKVASMKKELALAVKEGCEAVPENADAFETELALHDYLIAHCSVAGPDEGNEADTAYGALVNGKARCGGYAYAFKMMLDECGIRSYVVYGKVNVKYDPQDASSSEYEEHAWNIVARDGKYYHTDVIWDDADFSGLGSDGLVFHGCFDLDTTTVSKDHIIENASALPKANSSDPYYIRKGYYAESAEDLTALITGLLGEAADSGSGCIELLCGEEAGQSELAAAYKAAAAAVNAERGSELILDAFEVFPASYVTGAVTIRIFYPTIIETPPVGGEGAADTADAGEADGQTDGGTAAETEDKSN